MLLPEIITLSVLIFLELMLGIDNIIFISIAINKLENGARARFFGLGLALLLRITMLFGLSWILKLSEPILFSFSIKDILLFVGGVFLLIKALHEIRFDIASGKNDGQFGFTSGINIILQIALIDLVFSFDSIMVALALTKDVLLIIIAFIITIAFMLFVSGYISKYIDEFPGLKMLSLAFILVIGAMLILESIHIEVEKSYIYFAFSFSLVVEILNILNRLKR